jgi:hypothetical protein
VDKCIGRNSCCGLQSTVPWYGPDPCAGTSKRLYVQLTCTSTAR